MWLENAVCMTQIIFNLLNPFFMTQNVVYISFYYLCLRLLLSFFLVIIIISHLVLFYFITTYISRLPQLLFLNTNLILSLFAFSKSFDNIPSLRMKQSLSWETKSFIIWLQVIFLRKPHLVLAPFLPLPTHTVFQLS